MLSVWGKVGGFHGDASLLQCNKNDHLGLCCAWVGTTRQKAWPRHMLRILKKTACHAHSL
uniref:Uncharacterized protein n=1 Tax=Populus trichocarpa TaxID=3694 RepID=A0A3N7EF43_POPTR